MGFYPEGAQIGRH